jgi:hypothetical protein
LDRLRDSAQRPDLDVKLTRAMIAKYQKPKTLRESIEAHIRLE